VGLIVGFYAKCGSLQYARELLLLSLNILCLRFFILTLIIHLI
jgi:hypothetical protein